MIHQQELLPLQPCQKQLRQQCSPQVATSPKLLIIIVIIIVVIT